MRLRSLVFTALAGSGVLYLTTMTRDQPGPWRELLADGKAEGWRGYRRPNLPEGWQVIDGALTRVGAGGDIVYGTQQFANFELELEWKLGTRGNSGIFFRASEATDRIFENATEMQVLDNIAHPDNRTDLTVSGANYGLYPAARDAVRPVGEWNTARIVARGPHVEHWLNGRKVVTYEMWSPDWEAKVKASKFNQWPSYGRASTGFIGLQDHGDRVAFRNIRIRELP
ncbi:MAG: 3-keto-disaccharide hydrolase [Gemmatimonadota bacterium]